MNTLDNVATFPITGIQIALNIAVAVICGFAISFVYRNTYRGPGYSIAFANAIVLLTMICALVIMTIGSNVARAFGLVGAMKIVPVAAVGALVALLIGRACYTTSLAKVNAPNAQVAR